ncbi:MAG: SDR family NAD(P)-dependent oxidoreductase [Chloroflexota bacterium]
MNIFPIRLKDKVVLITGASSGFGEDAARLFAQAGCKVVLAARRLDRLQAMADKIHREGGEALAIPVDITNSADIENMVETTLLVYEQIDILFNNAGIGRVDWFENHTTERDIELLIHVNLVGLMQVTRAVLPYMLARRRGHIINMSSVAGLIASPLIASYNASKFGVRGFTDALRREVAPLGIHVTGVYPGPATTEFGQHTGSTRTPAYRSVRARFSTRMTSEYVARRVVDTARWPRRSLIIPWWFRVLVTLEMLFPAIADWILYRFSKKNHIIEQDDLK